MLTTLCNKDDVGNSKNFFRILYAIQLMGVFAGFWAFFSQFELSVFSIFISLISSVVLTGIFVFSSEKAKYGLKLKALSLSHKAMIYFLFGCGFFCASAFVFCYSLHFMCYETRSAAVYVVPLGETGRKLSHCDYTLRIIEVGDFLQNDYGAKAKEICVDHATYRQVQTVYKYSDSKQAKIFFAENKVSIFGNSFIEGSLIHKEEGS